MPSCSLLLIQSFFVSSASISVRTCMKRNRSLIAPVGTLLSLWVESGVMGQYQPKDCTVLLWGKWDPQFFSRRLRFVLFDPPNCTVMTHDLLYFTLPWHIQFVKARIFYHKKLATLFRVRKTPGDYDSEVIEMTEIWYGNQKKPGPLVNGVSWFP